MDRDHLHHILQKLARNTDLAREILEVQRTLYYKYGIDPFIGREILIYAPNITGQHGYNAMRLIIDQLKAAFARNAETEEIIELLRRLGRKASKKGR